MNIGVFDDATIEQDEMDLPSWIHEAGLADFGWVWEKEQLLERADVLLLHLGGETPQGWSMLVGSFARLVQDEIQGLYIVTGEDEAVRDLMRVVPVTSDAESLRVREDAGRLVIRTEFDPAAFHAFASRFESGA